jgi:Hypothetical protein (DUF2513)
MKRDMDLIRELLLKIENGQTSFILTSDTAAALSLSPAEGGMTAEAAAKLEEHLILLEQAGFIEIMSGSLSGHYAIKRLAWEGHDFLDSIRDPKIWEKTKKGVEGAGGFTVDLLKDLAKGFMKKQIEEYTGVKL